MKLPSDDTPVQSAGLQDRTSFTIKESKEAFRFLSSGLYSNKIRAVIRELSCNAVDAHTFVKASHVPIEVKIPNRLDPIFYVKDFGPGLTHDQVMGLYTTYFKSTKQNSNEMIGGLGVGSKSAFAYTKMYTIESRVSGEVRTYSAFIEDDEPQCALMGTAQTDEPNGLTVSFVARERDFWSFAQEAQEVFQWFSVSPTLKGAESQILPINYTKVTPSVSLPALRYVSEAIVRMGGVAYPLGRFSDQISADDPSREAFSWVSNVKALLEAPIGSMRKAASGEEIDYDNRTVASLKSIIENAFISGTEHVLNMVLALDSGKWQDRKQGNALLESARMSSLWHSKNTSYRYESSTPLLNQVAARCGVEVEALAPFTHGLEPYAWDSFTTLRIGRANVTRGARGKKSKVHTWQDIREQQYHKSGVADLPGFHDNVHVFLDDVPIKNRWADRAWTTWQKNIQPEVDSLYLFVIQPINGMLGTLEFEAERQSLMQILGYPHELGALSSGLSIADKKAFLARSEQSVEARGLGKEKVLRVYDNKPFYWVGVDDNKSYTDGEDSQFGQAGKDFLAMLRNEGTGKYSFIYEFLKKLELQGTRVQQIAEADIPRVRTFDNARSLLDVLVENIQSNKVLESIHAIDQVLDVGESYGRCANLVAALLYEAEIHESTRTAIEGTSLGNYVEKLRGYRLKPAREDTIKLMSFATCLNALAGNTVKLPYKHVKIDIDRMLQQKYPMLSRNLPSATSDPVHLRAYVQWCEEQHRPGEGLDNCMLR
jgi:hypothetical protein